MPNITAAILDKFYPHIKTAIAAAIPAGRDTLFIDESSVLASAARLL
jgi:hypothetical protein